MLVLQRQNLKLPFNSDNEKLFVSFQDWMAISASTHVHGEVEVGEEANEEVDKEVNKEVDKELDKEVDKQLDKEVGRCCRLFTGLPTVRDCRAISASTHGHKSGGRPRPPKTGSNRRRCLPAIQFGSNLIFTQVSIALCRGCSTRKEASHQKSVF